MTPDKSILATYLPTATVSATFVNERAADRFAAFWVVLNLGRLLPEVDGRKVSLRASERNQQRFTDMAMAFNAAAEHAAEIAEVIQAPSRTCPWCGGSGDLNGNHERDWQQCTYCDGTGEIAEGGK